jgi:uncharacterized protein YtpQ (UPF0354 family)
MRRVVSLAVLLICVVGLSAAAWSEPLSPREFNRQFVLALTSALPSANITVKGDFEVTIKDAEGKEATVFLDNAYATYSQDQTRLQDVIATYVSSLVEMRHRPPTFDRSRIVPIIKDRAWLEEIRKSLSARARPPDDIVFDELNDELLVFYAEDTPKNIHYLTPKDLETAGIDAAALRPLAVANLKKLLPRVELRTGPLVSMITAGGDYDASLLLFDDVWTNKALRVDGDVVVAVPSRDVVIFTGSNNKAGLEQLRQMAAKFTKQSAYRLTETLFIRRDGRFTRLDPH